MGDTKDRGDSLGVDDSDDALSVEVEITSSEEELLKKLGVSDPALEEEAEPEAKVEPEPEPEAKAEKEKFIPVNRHKDILENERLAREVAERKVQELQDALHQQASTQNEGELQGQISELRTQKAKATMDGDADAIVALETQIDSIRDQIAIQRNTDMNERAKAEAREEIRFDAAVKSLEDAYDAFNPKSDEFDQDLVDIVIATRDSLVASERLAPSAALLKAAEKILKKMVPVAPEPEEKPGLAAGKTVAGDRKTAAVAKNVDAARRQPPDLKNVGADSDAAGVKSKVDYLKLTSEERAALPEATRARLRGDLVDEAA